VSHIVGIDISLTGTGLACTCGKLARFGKDGITTLGLFNRISALTELASEITEWTWYHTGHIWGSRPALAVMEMPAYSKKGAGSVERHHLWMTVADDVWRQGDIPVAEVTATALKLYATGKGSAVKGAMVDACARRMPQFATGGNDNLADAAWLAAMGADRSGTPLCDMPQANRAALAKVTWPQIGGAS
jgi:crossover junction endodeoxyribonuclease RuvC